jgi:hypothetical protein
MEHPLTMVLCMFLTGARKTNCYWAFVFVRERMIAPKQALGKDRQRQLGLARPASNPSGVSETDSPAIALLNMGVPSTIHSTRRDLNTTIRSRRERGRS